MHHATIASRRRIRSRRLLSLDDENPLDGVANLFDATIVLSVALMIALLARPMLRSEAQRGDATSQQLEAVAPERAELPSFRLSGQTVGGDGERLGVAYRLTSGEVICVTEEIDGK
jgi:hypothetical protein